MPAFVFVSLKVLYSLWVCVCDPVKLLSDAFKMIITLNQSDEAHSTKLNLLVMTDPGSVSYSHLYNIKIAKTSASSGGSFFTWDFLVLLSVCFWPACVLYTTAPCWLGQEVHMKCGGREYYCSSIQYEHLCSPSVCYGSVKVFSPLGGTVSSR